MSKREQQLTDEMKEFLSRKVGELVMLTQQNAAGRFNPPSMDDDESGDAETSDDDDESSDAKRGDNWTSLSYPTDSRSRDERILQGWEEGNV